MTHKTSGHLTTSPPGTASRRAIATFASYGEAERAVDYLSDRRFPVERLVLAAYGLIMGAVIGAVFGLIGYALQGGRRDFTSMRVMMPSSYELQVDEEVAAEAVRLLAEREGAQATP